jgi:anti-sigma B factor antagonist
VTGEPPDDLAVVSPKAEIDLAGAPAFREALAQAVEGDDRDVLVDMSGVTFIDSTGLSALLNALRRLTRSRRQMLVVAPEGPVRRVITLTGLESTFPLYSTLAEAMADRGRPG